MFSSGLESKALTVAASCLGSDLGTVKVVTLLGAEYVFPDMPRASLDSLVLHTAWENGSLALVNVSGSVLSLPARIVASVTWNNDTLYQRTTF